MRKTVSMFAATICSSVSSPATFRENLLRRGRTALMTARRPASCARSATQSPTAGYSWRAPRAMPQAAGNGGQQIRVPRVDRVDVLVLERDAGGHQALRGECAEVRREPVVPAEREKIHEPERSTALAGSS